MRYVPETQDEALWHVNVKEGKNDYQLARIKEWAEQLYGNHCLEKTIQSESACYSKSDNPKVTVIIPVFNTETWLRECLDSVVNQTLEAIEIICVNDGSTDHSPDILAEYSNYDTRITVLHQENRGCSSARNHGLQYAHGKYIYYLDSDDYLDLDAMASLYSVAESNQVEVLFFGTERFNNQNERLAVSIFGRQYSEGELITGRILFDKMLRFGFHPCVTEQFALREFLLKNDIKFLEGILHEDEIYTSILLVNASRVLAIHDVYYHYRVRDGSIMTTRNPFNHFESTFVATERLLWIAKNDYYNDLVALELLKRRAASLFQSAERRFRKLSNEQQASVLKDASFDCQFLFWIMRNTNFSIAAQTKLEEYQNESKEKIKALTAEKEKQRMENQLLKKRQDVLLVSLKTLTEERDKQIEDCKRLKESIDTLAIENARINMSWSYRIGRVVTWAPRKIRGGIRCYHDSGLIYTLRRIIEHLIGKK